MRNRTVTACVLGLLLGLAAARTCRAQCGELLANPGFEDGPGSLILLEDSVGIWTFLAEPLIFDLDVVDTLAACQTTLLPHSGQWFFGVPQGSGVIDVLLTQLIRLPDPPPATLTFSAWFDACGSRQVVLTLLFLSDRTTPINDTVGIGSFLDPTVGTWEKVTFSCVAVPPGAQYVWCEVSFPEGVVMDDASVTCDPCTVPVQPTTWGRIKSLYRN